MESGFVKIYLILYKNTQLRVDDVIERTIGAVIFLQATALQYVQYRSNRL